MLGVCKHFDDSERVGTEALAEEVNSEGFTGDYPVDFQPCQSLWVVQAGYEGEDIEIIATISSLEKEDEFSFSN